MPIWLNYFPVRLLDLIDALGCKAMIFGPMTLKVSSGGRQLVVSAWVEATLSVLECASMPFVQNFWSIHLNSSGERWLGASGCYRMGGRLRPRNRGRAGGD